MSIISTDNVHIETFFLYAAVARASSIGDGLEISFHIGCILRLLGFVCAQELDAFSGHIYRGRICCTFHSLKVYLCLCATNLDVLAVESCSEIS